MTHGQNRGRILALFERLNCFCELDVMVTSPTGFELEQDRAVRQGRLRSLVQPWSASVCGGAADAAESFAILLYLLFNLRIKLFSERLFIASAFLVDDDS